MVRINSIFLVSALTCSHKALFCSTSSSFDATYLWFSAFKDSASSRTVLKFLWSWSIELEQAIRFGFFETVALFVRAQPSDVIHWFLSQFLRPCLPMRRRDQVRHLVCRLATRSVGEFYRNGGAWRLGFDLELYRFGGARRLGFDLKLYRFGGAWRLGFELELYRVGVPWAFGVYIYIYIWVFPGQVILPIGRRN